MLGESKTPIIAVSDNMAAVPDMVRKWMPENYEVLGTDGFGRSDTREALRRFFEIDGVAVTLAALSQLVRKGDIDAKSTKKRSRSSGISNERNDITEL